MSITKRRFQALIWNKNGEMLWEQTSVTEEQKKGFNAGFVVTGSQWYLGGKLGFDVRKVEYIWTFYSVDYEKVPTDFMVQILRDEYGVDLPQPKPIGAIDNFKLSRLKK